MYKRQAGRCAHNGTSLDKCLKKALFHSLKINPVSYTHLDVYKRQVYDEAKTVEDTVEIAVQINGKTKGTLEIGKQDPRCV